MLVLPLVCLVMQGKEPVHFRDQLPSALDGFYASLQGAVCSSRGARCRTTALRNGCCRERWESFSVAHASTATHTSRPCVDLP